MKNLIIASLIIIMVSCKDSERKPTGYMVTSFKNTPSWELAKAVRDQNVKKIIKICQKNPDLINEKDPYHGMSLLNFAIKTELYNSAKALLELGADPDFEDFYGNTPLTQAASIYETSDFVRLLINHGADVNKVGVGVISKPENPTPLISAAKINFESVKLLVESGADVNYRYGSLQDALYASSLNPRINVMHYLIFETEADVHRFYGKRSDGTIINIRDIIPFIGEKPSSEAIRMLKDIVEHLEEQGVKENETGSHSGRGEASNKDYL
ncbi:MAG: ankyrin repeat domain-containing protein [Cryomorphaceae bacterium]|nr:ankyrin repeat domain-containing protein [Cryomorphaceae bacterium]